MNEADIYRYSNRADVDKEVRAMQDRIVEELRAVRPDAKWGLLTQAADGREEYRPRLGPMEARREAQEVTADYQRAQYMRIEREVEDEWGWDA